MLDTPHTAGCDVRKATLDVCLSDGIRLRHKSFPNTPDGHTALVAWLASTGPVRIAVEATGTYSFDLLLALDGARSVELMVVNPRAARRFAEAQMTRSKTDRVDAASLCEFARRMEFVAWQPPEPAVLALRAIARRMQALTVEATRERNRLGHAQATRQPPCLTTSPSICATSPGGSPRWSGRR